MGNSYDERRQSGRHTQVFQNTRGGRPLGPPHTEFRTSDVHLEERGGRGGGGPRLQQRDDLGERGFQDAMRVDRPRYRPRDIVIEQRQEPPAHFRGKGPRNYKRSDSRIMEDVYDALTYQNLLDATDVEVTVEDAEVILKGLVNSRQEKRNAEDLAHTVRGVHDVRNELRIKREGQEPAAARPR